MLEIMANGSDERGGSVRYNTLTSNAFIVRPTLYLTTNTLIKSGNGTSSNPYQLSL